MSTEASINIRLFDKKSKGISSIKVIQKLMNYGWTLNDNGKISYLPLGDIDEFDWKNENISIESLENILIQKEKRNEIVGVVITWKETGVGGTILFGESQSFSINLSINRRMLNDEKMIKITDVNWYLTKLLPALNEDELVVESISYEEY